MNTSKIEQIIRNWVLSFDLRLSNGTSPNGDWWKNILVGKGKERNFCIPALKTQQKLRA